MPDTFYPSVDIDFLVDHAISSGKLAKDGIIMVGDTITLVAEGPQAIWKRASLIRYLTPGQVCLEQAIAIALKFSFMGILVDWLEENRGWKEGAYIVPKEVSSRSKPLN